MKRVQKNIFIIISALYLCGLSSVAQQADSLTLDTMAAFTSIQQAIKQPEKVVKLILRKQKLKEFPKEILLFKNLQYLDLTKNSIKELPHGIDSLHNLEVLILSKNDLEQLPKEIGRLKMLRNLNVNQNELTSLPPEIGNLDNLEFLDLWSNNIDTFPEQIGNLSKLKVMDLRVIMIDEEEQQHLQGLLPKTKIFFSPGCRCKTQ